MIFSSYLKHVIRVSDWAKCISLSDEPCIVRPTLIFLNPSELKHYLLIISLVKCNESCSVLSPKIFVSKKTKDVNVKVFNMIKNKNEAKTVTKHIWCDCKCKVISTNAIRINNRIIKYVNVNVKIVTSAKKIIVGILGHVFVL